jgi:hypothetical protein
VEPLLAFSAALLALRLSGAVFASWRSRRAPQLLAWAAALFAYSIAAAALAWGIAHGWDSRAFRVYYLFGGLLTAPLLGVGSLLLWRRRWATALGLLYSGLATGIAISMPVHGSFAAQGIPAAQDHLTFVPARLLAVIGNSAGTIAVVVVAALTFRRRPVGNLLIVAGMAVAAIGSALAGLGSTQTSLFAGIAVVLLYLGFGVHPRRRVASEQ